MMTIEELIQELEALRDRFGPHAEVFKRRINAGDGSTQYVPVKEIKVAMPDNGYPIITL